MSREDFIKDKDVKMIGYQPNFKKLKLGLFLFNHSCRTTISIQASEFEDLHLGEIYKDSLRFSSECYGKCVDFDNLEPCDRKCECAYVRDIIQKIK